MSSSSAAMVRHCDSQGREIEVGQRVAYNMSGQVVPGVVLDVQWGHIKVSCESRNHSAHVSRVRNPLSIMVLAGVAIEGPHGSPHWLPGGDA